MKENYTHITVVLDRSGSMASVANDTIGGFNKFLETHQRAEGDCTMTLVKFDDLYEVHAHAQPVRGVAPLNTETFVPRGNTALLGAIGKAIDETGAALRARSEQSRPAKVIFVVITDGQENASHTVAWARDKDLFSIRRKIEHQTGAYKWQFLFIGANMDAIGQARDMGIAACNAMDYTANATGTQSLYNTLADNTAKYRSGAAAATSFTTADRRAQTDAKIT